VGANIKIVENGFSTTSIGTGAFELNDLQEGLLTLEISASGYQSVQATTVVSRNTLIDAGTIYLKANVSPSTSKISGVIRDAGTQEPIVGAEITVGDINTVTDSNGTYIVEGIAGDSITVTAKSIGYITSTRQLTIVEPTNINLDVNLTRAVVEQLDITNLTTTKIEYASYETVDIVVTLQNSGTLPKNVRLYLKVENSNGNVLEQYPVVQIPLGSNQADATVYVDTNASVSTAAQWKTKYHDPDVYRIIVQAFDSSTAVLLAERSTNLNVLPAAKIESVDLEPSINYTTVGASENIELSALIHNQSNIGQQISFNFHWNGPNGASDLRSGVINASLLPNEEFKTIILDQFQYLFTESGQYTITIENILGAIPSTIRAQALQVAPGKRINIQQGLSPQTVVPDSAKKIKIKIRLEGVEQ
jgi:hypothetical protein